MYENAIIFFGFAAIVFAILLCDVWFLRCRVRKTEQSIREIECGEHRFKFIRRKPAGTRRPNFPGSSIEFHHNATFVFQCYCGAVKNKEEGDLSDEQAVALRALGYCLSVGDLRPQKQPPRTADK